MNYDRIVKEWFYRLPKGYAEAPYSDAELKVLDEVLAEHNISLKEEDDIDESYSPEDFTLPDSFVQKITNGLDGQEPKQAEFEAFLASMPGGQTNIILQNFFDRMTPSDENDFIKLLYSKNRVEDISKKDYSSGLGAKLYDLEPKGVGRGEIFLAALIRGAKVSGGGESFDLTVGADRYEVKDYRTGDSKAIRLGTKGNVVRYPFWNQLLTTVELMEELDDSGLIKTLDNPGITEFAEYLKSAKKGRSRYEMIPTGEFNKTDLQEFTKGYQALGEYAQHDAKGYTMVVLRGPNVKPKAFNIEELPANVKDKFSIVTKGDAGLENLVTRLRKIAYIRNPKALEADIDAAVKKAIGTEIPYIVFRKSGIKITNDFDLHSISQGGIRILER